MINNNEKKLKNIEKVFLCVIAGVVFLGGIISGYINAQIKNYAGIENLQKFQPSVPTRLYDVNGDLIAELFQEKRDLVAFEDLPPSLINAFLASEDKDFYEHFGLNPMAIARAMVKNVFASVKSGRLVVAQGGSTITQQLAKRLFTDSDRTFARKALEAVLTFQIEKKFSKEEILEMYFNQIYLGHGCHGIATASRFFFDKDVRHLSVIESSVLSALPSRPTGYSPLREPRAAVEKNRDTLRRMVNIGFLTQEEADKLFQDFWPSFIDSLKTEFPTKTASSNRSDNAPFFVDYVRQILLTQFGEDIVYKEGLTVYTTLDLKKQLIAQKHMEEGLTRQNAISNQVNAMYNSAVDRSLFSAYNQLRLIFGLPGVLVQNDEETIVRKRISDEMIDSLDILSILTDAPEVNKVAESFRGITSSLSTSLQVEGAFIAIEPSTGYISTMIGGSEYSVSNQYNRAVQARRQPGSSFKPFVYGAAVEAKKISPSTTLLDAPIIDIDAAGDTWSPGNYEGNYSGMVTVRRALASSINIISIRIFDIIGGDTIVDYASKMTKAPAARFTPSPALALGASEMTPLEMATGYAIYANRGRDVIPFSIRYIEDRDGNELINFEEEVGRVIAQKEMNGTIQVISEDVSYVMTSLLQSVVEAGTASDAIRGRAGFREKAAGKTGTTQNWTDAWFCGFTPDIVAVVWVGYDRAFMSLGKHQAGASVAAPIWASYMRDIYNQGMPRAPFPPQPPGVIGGGSEIMIRGATVGGYGYSEGSNQKMKSVLDEYLEQEGLK